MPAWETRGGVLGPQGWVFPCVGLCWVWNSSGSLTLPPLSLLGAGSPSAFPSGKFCPALSLQQHNHGGRGLSLSSPVSPPPPHNPAPRGEPAPPPPPPGSSGPSPTCGRPDLLPSGSPGRAHVGGVCLTFYLRSDSRCQTPCPAPPHPPPPGRLWARVVGARASSRVSLRWDPCGPQR